MFLHFYFIFLIINFKWLWNYLGCSKDKFNCYLDQREPLLMQLQNMFCLYIRKLFTIINHYWFGVNSLSILSWKETNYLCIFVPIFTGICLVEREPLFMYNFIFHKITLPYFKILCSFLHVLLSTISRWMTCCMLLK